MGKDLIISQHALHATLEHVAEKSSFQKWAEEVRECPNTDRRRLSAVLEAASSDPVGLAILARSVVHGETYQQAVRRLPFCHNGSVSVAAVNQRIARLQKRILGS